MPRLEGRGASHTAMFHQHTLKVLSTGVFLLLFFFEGIAFPAGQKQARYVSLTPATTEILFALGLDEEIAAVTTYCNYPGKALAKDKVGTFSEPSIEKILSLKPALVFATGLEQAQTVERLKQVGIEVQVSDPSTIAELIASIEAIGQKTNRTAEAKRLTADMKKRIERIREKINAIPASQRQKVFLEIWQDPLLTAGKGSIVDEIITCAGGINIAHDTLRPYSYFSQEQVVARNPDCIILGHRQGKYSAVEAVYARTAWRSINAVKKKRVYNDIDPDTLLRPGPRIIDGLEALYKKLYEP